MRIFILLLALIIPSSVLAAQCDDWLEPEFWAMASADVVKVCLQTRSIDEENILGFRPLDLASIFTRDPQVIKLLLDRGSNPDAMIGTTGQNAFIGAIIHNGRPEIIRLFIDFGINVDQKVQGTTALHLLAYMVGNEKEAEGALAEAALTSYPFLYPNKTEFTYKPDSSLISILVAAGADINSRAEIGQTPLVVAAQINENPNTIDLLISAGADVDLATDKGQTPLMASNYLSQNPTVGVQLIAAGASVTAVDVEGRTALFYASFSKLKSATTLATFVDALLDAGVNINVTTDALETPLHNAMFGQANPFLAKILMDRGADLNPIDADGHTPLHHGVMYAHDPDRILLLLHAGADPSIIDNDGKTPWDYVEENETLSESQKALLADALRPSEKSR